MSWKSNINLSSFISKKSIIFFLALFFCVFAMQFQNIAYADRSKVTVEPKSCDTVFTNDVYGVKTEDVACSCKPDECRLSSKISKEIYQTMFDCFVAAFTNPVEMQKCSSGRAPNVTFGGTYMCVKGGTTAADSFVVGHQKYGGDNTQNEDFYFNQFQGPLYNIGNVIKNDGSKDVKGYVDSELLPKYPELQYYLDVFTNDSSRSVIPQYSYCKLQDGVAYWYYPGYFDRVQGKSPSPDSGEGSTARCSENVAFTSTDLFGKKVDGTDTFFGCLPNSFNGVIAFVIRLATGLAILVTILIVLLNLLQIVTQSTNADAVSAAQKNMSSAVFTLIGILLTVTILSFLGIQILSFGSESSLGGSFFNFLFGQ